MGHSVFIMTSIKTTDDLQFNFFKKFHFLIKGSLSVEKNNLKVNLYINFITINVFKI